jgi:hypothetical protein
MLLLFNKKLDYIQWICVVVFLCLVVVFQMFLLILVVEDSKESLRGVSKECLEMFCFNWKIKPIFMAVLKVFTFNPFPIS